MAAHKMAALIALLFLALAAVLCIIGTATLHWLEAEVEIKQAFPLPNPDGSVMSMTLKIEMDSYFGLRKTCNDLEIDFKHIPKEMRQLLSMSMGFSLPYKTTMCLTKDGIPKGQYRDELLHSMRHFRRILICMVVGLVLLLSAVIVSLAKSPCVKMKVKKSLLILTVLLALASVIPILTGIVIAGNELHGDADFVRIGLKGNLEKFPLIPGGPGRGTEAPRPSQAASTSPVVSTSKATVSTNSSSPSTNSSTNATKLQPAQGANASSTTPLPSNANGTTLASTRSATDLNTTATPGVTQPRLNATTSGLATGVSVNTTAVTMRSNLTGNASTTLPAPKTTGWATTETEPDGNGPDLGAILLAAVAKQVKDSMAKGYSYKLVCAGVVFIFLAILVTILEYYFAKKSGEGEYDRELLKSDGYDMPSKSAPETA